MSHRRGLTPANGAIYSWLQSQELAKALRPHMAKARWAEVVGPQVAGVTQVEKIQNGTELVVRVKNSVWANELVLLKGDMIRRLNTVLGGPVLTDIHFKASGLSKKKRAELPAEAPLPPAPSDDELAQTVVALDARRRIEASVSGIKDENLRSRVRRAMLRAARAEQWKRDRGWLPCARCGGLAFPSDLSQSPFLCPLCHAGAT